jgi:hypothetical protein
VVCGVCFLKCVCLWSVCVCGECGELYVCGVSGVCVVCGWCGEVFECVL